jgi:glycosyltransferase involved in cell wall biosynthesis
MATHHAPVDETLVESDYDYDVSGMPRQGFRVFCPQAKAPVTVIHNGYDYNLFKRNPQVKRIKNSFLTVASTVEGREFYRKGIDLILAIAPAFPDCSFTIVGKTLSSQLGQIPGNVSVVPPMPNNKLVDVYSAHEYYFQISIAEGFPNALCEAMLCECIPIGSNVFGIPKIINECGFILKKRDVELLKIMILQALKADKLSLSSKARLHIQQNFPLERREAELTRLIETLI